MTRHTKKEKRQQKKSRDLFAWSDERGNSGHNVFDQEQPMFWYGTILSGSNLDNAGKLIHQEWLDIVKTEELHGNDLGIGKINQIASSVREFLEQHQCRFVFTRIDKQFAILNSLAGMLLSIGERQAVLQLHRVVPIFRKKLAHDLARFLSPSQRLAFWHSLEGHDLQAFSHVLQNIQLRMMTNPDRRAVSIYSNALGWASMHPDKVLETITKEDSPNIQALLLQIYGIQKSIGRNEQIISFCHDEQEQFGATISEMFDVFKNIGSSFSDPYTPPAIIDIDSFICRVALVPSITSVGLQLVDVLLYLMSRHFNGTYAPRGDDCGSLLGFLLDGGRTLINEMLYGPQKLLTFAEYEEMALNSSLYKPDGPPFKDLVASRLLNQSFRMMSYTHLTAIDLIDHLAIGDTKWR